MGLSESVLVKNKNARWLFAGQWLSQVFDRVTSLGLIWFLSEKFSVSMTSWFLVFAGLPHLLLALKSGPWIQRIGILRTLIWSDYFRSALYFVASIAVYAGGFESLPWFFALAFLTNVAASLFNPAVMTVPLSLAAGKEVQSLTALLTSCGSFAVVLGPLIGVLLFQRVGLSGIFLITAFAYAVAGFASARVSLAVQADASATSAETSPESLAPSLTPPVTPPVTPPLEVLRRYRVIALMLGSFLAMNLLLGPLQVIFPAYAKEVYGRAFDGMAWLESSLGLGMIAGGLLLSFVELPWSKVRNIAVTLSLASLSYLAFAVATDFVAGRLAIGAFGFFLSGANVVIINLFQSEPAESDVPQVMAFANLIGVAAAPLSLVLTSFAVQKIAITTFAIGTSAALVVVSIFTAFVLNAASRKRVQS
jgi:predicted MFS family arabinose efflux permease